MEQTYQNNNIMRFAIVLSLILFCKITYAQPEDERDTTTYKKIFSKYIGSEKLKFYKPGYNFVDSIDVVHFDFALKYSNLKTGLNNFYFSEDTARLFVSILTDSLNYFVYYKMFDFNGILKGEIKYSEGKMLENKMYDNKGRLWRHYDRKNGFNYVYTIWKDTIYLNSLDKRLDKFNDSNPIPVYRNFRDTLGYLNRCYYSVKGNSHDSLVVKLKTPYYFNYNLKDTFLGFNYKYNFYNKTVHVRKSISYPNQITSFEEYVLNLDDFIISEEFKCKPKYYDKLIPFDQKNENNKKEYQKNEKGCMFRRTKK